jgi:hypothetical protein
VVEDPFSALTNNFLNSDGSSKRNCRDKPEQKGPGQLLGLKSCLTSIAAVTSLTGSTSPLLGLREQLQYILLAGGLVADPQHLTLTRVG